MASFFIGITLPQEFSNEIEGYRRRFKAPRTEPHITLIPPFDWDRGESALKSILDQRGQRLSPFTVTGEGLGSFGTGVIFVKVNPSPELVRCHNLVRSDLERVGVTGIAERRGYHPHITLATRLSREQYHVYMDELADYRPVSEFVCSQLAWFQLSEERGYRRWQVLEQIRLQG